MIRFFRIQTPLVFVILVFSISVLFSFSLTGSPEPRQDSDKDSLDVRIGIYPNPPLIDARKGGRAKGIFADILRHIASQEGWNAVFVEGTLREGLDRLEKNEIDLLPAVVYTDELSKRFRFTRESIITNWARVYAKDTSEICSFLDLDGKRIAVLKDDVHYVGQGGIKDLAEEFEVDCTYIEETDYRQVFAAVEKGRADAGVVNRLFGSMQVSEYDLAGTAMIFNPQQIRIALQKEPGEIPVLKGVLDRYLADMKRTGESVYYQSLEKHLGVSGQPVQRWPGWLIPVLFSGGILLVVLMAAGMFFRWEVARKTRELRRTNERLQDDNVLRRKVEAALRTSEENYRAIFNSANDAILIYDMENGVIRDINSKAEEMFGHSLEEARKLDIGDLSSGDPPYSIEEAMEKIRLAAKGKSQLFVWMAKDRKGRIFWTEVNLKRSTIGGKDRILAVTRDITRRKFMEEQYRQSQKMEAVGQLAGGVAHDFNNLLTAILGYSAFLSDRLPEEDPGHNSAVMIHRAAKRAADLTRQLLAFSRKQVLAKKVLDLNEVLGNMEKMLRRVIGEDIELETSFTSSLASVKADLGQIEQIVMNLALNARDAMPSGGRISMKTSNVELDSGDALEHAGLRPGAHVLFSITDTGVGMDDDILPRIFEPFFTRKADGKGTGLGLSTVYGIVKQHKGHITVSSEPGSGTTFEVILPVPGSDDDSSEEIEESKRDPTGTETVLVVEDEDLVRKLAGRILEMHGYTVFLASNPEEAKRISADFEGEIDLLLSDVIMPQMDGGNLFDFLAPLRPGLKVLFMSGYTSQSPLLRGIVDRHGGFLQKPFNVDTLTLAVREVLDAPVGEEAPSRNEPPVSG